MTVKQCAKAFAEGRAAHCHNARVTPKPDGSVEYRLHGNLIAKSDGEGWVECFWCGWYGPTTANHLNKILAAIGAGFRVSYAKARDNGTTMFQPFAAEVV